MTILHAGDVLQQCFEGGEARTRWAMKLLLLLALAAPLICLALLSSLGILGILTLGLVLHVVGTSMARMPQRPSSYRRDQAPAAANSRNE